MYVDGFTFLVGDVESTTSDRAVGDEPDPDDVSCTSNRVLLVLTTQTTQLPTVLCASISYQQVIVQTAGIISNNVQN